MRQGVFFMYFLRAQTQKYGGKSARERRIHSYFFLNKLNSPGFSVTGSDFIFLSSEPVSAITALSFAISGSVSERITVSPFVCDDETFFTAKLRRMQSFMCDSHIPHIMPSILRTVLIIFIILSLCAAACGNMFHTVLYRAHGNRKHKCSGSRYYLATHKKTSFMYI